MLSVILTNHLSLLLGLNTVLILVDAAIGYHLAPLLMRKGGADDDVAEAAVQGVRRLLSLLVALYMFFSCLAYVRHQQTFLIVVTLIILLDIAIQLIVRRQCHSNTGR